jgi:hypothetical protein
VLTLFNAELRRLYAWVSLERGFGEVVHHLSIGGILIVTADERNEIARKVKFLTQKVENLLHRLLNVPPTRRFTFHVDIDKTGLANQIYVAPSVTRSFEDVPNFDVEGG